MKNQTLNLGQLLSLVKYPSLTEKSINLYGNRQYTFVVDRTLTKTQIKYLIEKIFNITVTSINTCILPTKTRRVGKFVGKRSVYKKAYVKLNWHMDSMCGRVLAGVDSIYSGGCVQRSAQFHLLIILTSIDSH